MSSGEAILPRHPADSGRLQLQLRYAETGVLGLSHRHAGRGPRQSRLEAAGRFFTAEAMRNRNHERCGHFEILQLIQTHVIPHRSKVSAVRFACFKCGTL